MTRKDYSQVLLDVAQDQLSSRQDLTPRILSEIHKQTLKNQGVKMKLSMKLMVTTVVVMLAVFVFLIASPSVVSAIQRWIGYIPGFGLVRGEEIRQLAEPVSMNQGEVTLIMEKALANQEKAVLTFEIQGIDQHQMDEHHFCNETDQKPQLLLPDGSQAELRQTSVVRGGGSYSVEVKFVSLPGELTEATLVIPCIEYTSADQVPQQWEVPLHFKAAASAMPVAPVLDAPATVAPVVETAPFSVAEQTAETDLPENSQQTVMPLDGLKLISIIPTQTGYILSGTISASAPEGYTISMDGNYLEDVTFTDANGDELQFGLAPGDFEVPDSSSLPENTYTWACEVIDEHIQWPLTMTVHSLPARGSYLPQAEFQFDSGKNPEPDTVWDLDQDVALGDWTVHFISARKIEGEYGGVNGYEFIYVYDPTLAFSIDLKGHEDTRRGGGGSGMPDENGNMVTFLAYFDPVPDGVLTVLVRGQELARIPGPWQVTWQEPLQNTPAP